MTNRQKSLIAISLAALIAGAVWSSGAAKYLDTSSTHSVEVLNDMAKTGGNHPGNVGGERGSSKNSQDAGARKDKDKAGKGGGLGPKGKKPGGSHPGNIGGEKAAPQAAKRAEVDRSSTPSKDDPVLEAWRGVIGALTPLGGAMAVGEEMGDRVTKMQQDIDAGKVPGATRADDPSMGRVDKVDGRAYSHGNPAADDRAKNVNGLGGGMTGGRGDGSKTLADAILGSQRNPEPEDETTKTANNAADLPKPDNFIDGEIDPETGLKKKKVKSVGLPFSYRLPVNNLFSI